MTIDQLKTFLVVSKLGSIHAAAISIPLTQPAVSARINALENSLGILLFERSKQGVKLTTAGQLLTKYAEQITYLSEKIKIEVSPPSLHHRLLRIGAAETIAQSWLPQLFLEIKAQYPNISIELTVDVTAKLRSGLLDHSLDISILMGPLSEYRIDNIVLPSFDLSWFCAKDTQNIELSKTPIITYHKTSKPFRELTSELRSRYENFQIFSTSSLSAGFNMIASGLGVGLLPSVIGQKQVQQGDIETFDPGWKPQPLNFTVSYMAEPRDEVIIQIAKMAKQIASN